MTDLRVDWCSYEAASYAVTHWHYSRVMPTGKAVKIGVWEDDQFVGAVLFGWGANRNLAAWFDLPYTAVAELTRVALTAHTSPVSQVVAAALKLLRGQSPGLRALISYADPAQGHHGGIYQAMGWIYTGCSPSVQHLRLPNGRVVHRRTYTGRDASPLPPGAVWEAQPGKHRYVLPLDKPMRRQLTRLAVPYPRPAVEGSEASRPVPNG